jgi:hypothetical protein
MKKTELFHLSLSQTPPPTMAQNLKYDEATESRKDELEVVKMLKVWS